jgi:spore coat polysaccharide biosynthesis protein SpsF
LADRPQVVGIIVQARMGSSRLPGKVLMNLMGKPMLVHMIERLKHCKKVDKIVIATSNLESDKQIAEVAQGEGVIGFIGDCDENDVLERYIQAANKNEIDVIVRVTADCPLIDPQLIDDLVEKFFELDVDYVTNSIEKTFPLGVDAEVFKTEALIASSYLSDDLKLREHVVLPMRNNQEKFKIVNIESEGELNRPELRLTVDKKEDFELIEQIYDRLYIEDNIFNIKDVIKLLDDNPELKNINADIK